MVGEVGVGEAVVVDGVGFDGLGSCVCAGIDSGDPDVGG